jgi:very-short-patch-repair endonuclease
VQPVGVVVVMTQTVSSQPMKRVEDWKSRLIDLSRRNSLLYFHRNKRGSLSISQPDTQTAFNLLVLKKKKLEFWLPPPEKAQDTETQEKPQEQENPKGKGKTKTAKTAKGNTQASFNETLALADETQRPKANQLVSERMSRAELERSLKGLQWRSLLDYRERGVRILHAAFGTLDWVDFETKEQVQSPLILVPLELTRDSIRQPYSIGLPPVEDEEVLNPALQVKLKNDYKIDLPPLPEEWENLALQNYFDMVNQAVAELGWKVETSFDLGLFSFQKLVIYKDLEANAPLVTQHPIVRAIAGIKEGNLIMDGLPDEKDVDKIEPPDKTHQVLDADSSQRVSIEYALRGQSFVMQGPPGTGKSQTIANIIAECIANGKSVLFVSDKMAALEVVYKRLSEVGLAHFCLELHSSKANKQQVVAELKRSLDENLIPRKLPSPHEFEKMVDYREALNGYVAALHEKRQYLQRSAYEVLSLISGLERVPFVSVGLTELGTLTPQKMHELEALVSQLSKVWQVIEEPDFPWVGYRADVYNLELRSEVLSALENISETLLELQNEAEDFSAKLGVFPPETFVRVKWLLEVTKFLIESPKPEVYWLTDLNIDKLHAEAKTYLETSIWIKNTRVSLMERYQPSLFDLVLNQSADIEKQLEALSRILPGVGLEESEFLPEREKFLAFMRGTAVFARKWRETSQALAPRLGLDGEGLTINQIKELSRMALLCFAEDKPEPQWFDTKYFEQVADTVRKQKQLYQDHGLLKSRLDETYTDGIFQLDLDGLIARYNRYSQNPLKLFNSSYRNDQKQIARVTNNGKVPKTVLPDLVDARKVKKLQAQIEESAETVRALLGHFYDKSKTDFQGAEKALELTAEIRKLNWATTIPENLLKLITNTSSPSPMIKNLGLELQESINKWEQQLKDYSMFIPANIPKSNNAISQTPLPLLEEWVTETEKQLTPLRESTNVALATSKQEPQTYKQLMVDLKNAEDIRKKEAAILGEKAQLLEKFGSRFSGLETNWQDIVEVIEWVKKVQAAFLDIPVSQAFAQLAAQGPSATPSSMELTRKYDASLRVLEDFGTRFEAPMKYKNQFLRDLEIKVINERIHTLRDRVDEIQVWVDFKDIKNRFALRGLDQFFNHLVEQKLPAADLVDVFRRGVYQEWINNLYNEDPKLGKFRWENHEQLIADFKKLDQDLIKLSSSMVIEEANSRKPQDILIQAADSEAAILQKEAAKKRQLMPIRVLFQKIPNLLVKLKPCLLMSPISVSQFLPPESKFDLVLFDEASQIVPEDAIGSIYRGKTVVVAGDNKQLPPTSFFQKSLFDNVDWDELSDEDVEIFDSILDECLGIGLPVKTLRWHYRSKHEDLIAFSNHRFYEDTLVTFPSAQAQNDTLGVKLVYVQNGIYDRGGQRNNIKEAEKVADLVFEHFRLYPKKTLGVVTFSVAQMETVEDAIDRQLKEQPDFEQFFKEDRLEGFFVKNLENVQGDERDVIFFSVGYGYALQKQMAMNFGPLNKPGGERRLNVAVTRAREKVVLVTSIKATDIDPEIKAVGVQTLRYYLDYAEHGPEALESVKAMEGEFESALDEDVAAEIKKMGYEVVPQVGCSGYRIDIGVVDPVNPGNFLLGVECDGASYKSSNSARDRDRLREQVLRQLGWRIHRVWSPAWVARRDSEIRRLKEDLEQASKQQIDRETQEPMIEIKGGMTPKTDVQKIEFAGIEKIGEPYKTYPLKASFNPYIRVASANGSVNSKQKNEFHFPENRENQTKLLAELVQNEGPVNFDYAVERLASAWGIKQVTPQVTHAVKEALNNLLREQKVVLKGSFLWSPTQRETLIRVPVQGIPETKRKASYIAPEEIESAMLLVTRYALGISQESLIWETARVFGLNRSAEGAFEVFSEILQRLVRDRKLVCKDDVVTVA